MKKVQSQPSVGREVSLQAQLEANDIPEFANEPGPGHYFGPDNNGFSSLGNQKFAKCPSAPEIKFPRTGWQGWHKVIISKGHEGAYKLRDSPGAVYWKDEPIPPSSLNKKTTGFPKSQRPDLSVSLGMNPKGSPGPAEYNVRDTKPIERKSLKGTMDSKAERFENRVHKGPGAYSIKDGLNLGSGKSFGCPRSSYDKVVRPGWEKEGQCKTSSKIGEGTVWTGLKTDGTGAYRIGKADRFPKDRHMDMPGPGQYRRDERDVSNCSSICSDTRNPGGAPFGRRLPRKPRFRQMLALTTATRGGWGYF